MNNSSLNNQKPHPSLGIMILAAGQGKRMRSNLPKILHPLCGEAMISHILRQVFLTCPHASIAIVIGHEKTLVEETIRKNLYFSKLTIHFIHQKEMKGTGDAARAAMDSEWGKKMTSTKTEILVLPGDLPLISQGLLHSIVEPLGRNQVIRLLTCELEDPTGYGRVVRRGKEGGILRIVEEKDANVREKQIKEVAVSIYLFNPKFLDAGLKSITPKNAQNEYYLTDLIGKAVRTNKKIDTLKWSQCEDLRGINDQWELSLATKILNRRILQYWTQKGVTLMDCEGTWIDSTVLLEEGVTVLPGAILKGITSIKKNTKIGANVFISDTQIGENCQIKTGTHTEESIIENGCTVGPYAHLRPGSHIRNKVKIGNFVELKKSTIDENTSIAHLSYLGDATVGKNVNIGCGFITCNYDGRVINGEKKHKTIIEDDVFMGSDCQAIAPITIGKGAYIASGSTLNRNVEPGSLAIARSKQENKIGYTERLKKLQLREAPRASQKEK